ncbi:hypothetical protein N8000_12015, partial [Rhodospirillales bacterium]|nr:hypothetical protein [Rhodospirillales bacterium]
MRAVFIGCVESSWRLLEVLLASDSIDVCGVVTRSASKFNTDFCSLEPLAAQASIPVFIDDGNNQQAMAD